jgi:hypothetical protein
MYNSACSKQLKLSVNPEEAYVRSYLLIGGLMLATLLAPAQQPESVLLSGRGERVAFCPQAAALGGKPPGCEVAVWSAKDTERLIAVAQANGDRVQNNLNVFAARYEKTIAILDADIKRLSDANDALTKRIKDLEEREKKQALQK